MVVAVPALTRWNANTPLFNASRRCCCCCCFLPVRSSPPPLPTLCCCCRGEGASASSEVIKATRDRYRQTTISGDVASARLCTGSAAAKGCSGTNAGEAGQKVNLYVLRSANDSMIQDDNSIGFEIALPSRIACQINLADSFNNNCLSQLLNSSIVLTLTSDPLNPTFEVSNESSPYTKAPQTTSRRIDIETCS